MTKQTMKHFALSLVVLGVVLTPPLSLAQARLAPKLPGKHTASSSAQAASRQAKTPDSPTYNYTLLSFPGTLYTYATGINPGATTSKIEIVGGTALTLKTPRRAFSSACRKRKPSPRPTRR